MSSLVKDALEHDSRSQESVKQESVKQESVEGVSKRVLKVTWGKTRGFQGRLLDHDTHTTLSYDDTYIRTGLGVWKAPFFRETFPAFQVHLLMSLLLISLPVPCYVAFSSVGVASC